MTILVNIFYLTHNLIPYTFLSKHNNNNMVIELLYYYYITEIYIYALGTNMK